MDDRFPAIAFVTEEVRRWIRRDPPTTTVPDGVSPAVFAEVVRKNRLQPLMNLRLAFDRTPPAWAPVLEQLGGAYRAHLLRAYRHLAASTGLAQQMEHAGIRCLAFRGPFFGLTLYEDAGARFFTDIDLLIPAARRRQALDVARAAGYGGGGDLLPLRFFERHHLHWRLENPGIGVICELHWALDHPYKPFSVDYDAIVGQSETRTAEGYCWREPHPNHLLIVAGMHAAKHCRVGRDYVEAPDFLRDMIEKGWLTHWLDVLAILRKHGDRLDWDVITRDAVAWGVEETLVTAVAGAARLMDGMVPGPVLARCAALSRPAAPSRGRAWRSGSWRGVERIAAMGGFRPECLRDAWAYVFPRNSGRGGNAVSRVARRAVHAVRACVCLGIAGLEMVGYYAVAVVRKRMTDSERNTASGDVSPRRAD